jgi:RNA polymerase sigma-70 factor (ECF subfamily)
VEATFVRLLEEHKALLFKVANAYSADRWQREDLVAETVAQLWRSFPYYDPARRFSTWAYRVALNVAISFRRSERRRSVHLIEDPIIIENIPEQSDSVSDFESVNALIAGLNDFDRALVLLYLEGYSHAECAEILGISTTNVGTKLNRLKTRLRRDIVAQRAEENVS